MTSLATALRLDIGGGLKPAPGHTVLDPNHGDAPWRRAAQETPWPTPDGSVAGILASHVLEHIPAGRDRIAVFNEAWRVLVPGGVFEVRVPIFPTWQAVADPTHVSFFVPQSFWYFTGDFGADADYGIRLWTWADKPSVRAGWELTVRLTPKGKGDGDGTSA